MSKSAAIGGRPRASAHAAAMLDNNTIGATNQNLGVALRYRQNGRAKEAAQQHERKLATQKP